MTVDTHLYLVSYDISSTRRWRRVYKALRKRGAWQQLSSFVCRLTPADWGRLECELASLIDARKDRLMVADLGTAAEATARLRRFGVSESLPGARVRIF